MSVKPEESEGLKDWITYVGRQCNALWERTCVYPINVNRQPVSTESLQLTKARFEILILLVCYCWYIIFFFVVLLFVVHYYTLIVVVEIYLLFFHNKGT